jgi:predicted O-methyltransferase YrrM
VQVLINPAKKLGPNAKYVETGSYLGGSSMIISKFSTATIWAHDIWLEPRPDLENAGPAGPEEHMLYRFYDAVKNNGLETRVIPIRGDSSYTLGIHDPESIDLAFIDGDHTHEGALKDFRKIWPLMKKGGVILAHDCVKGEGAFKAIVDFTRENDISFEVFPNTTGMARIIKDN